MILHTVNKSPSSSNALRSCLNLASTGSAILLLEDGVYGAQDIELNREFHSAEQMRNHTYYVLEDDLIARGISERIHREFKRISYAEFVDLSLQYSKVQSWS